MFEGRVVNRENLGSDVYLHVALDDGAHRLVVRAEPEAAAGAPLGASVSIDRRRGEALVFAPDGARLRFADGAAARAVA
jgi:multiple sugar transport system ATP-binding protein